MDKETLRKQLYEELNSQFEEKLREAKRQKSQLEEEMEESSEKWRDERRRLNSEIDRLESKLAEAREARRKTTGLRQDKPEELQAITRRQTEAEEKLQKATDEFSAERAKLQAEISRLERGIAELIERSNNPLRTTQLEKEKLDSKFEEALKAKRQAEDALIASKTAWDEEKLKLVSEIVKLSRSPNQAKVQKARQDEERVEQLEKRLQEAMGSRDGLVSDLDRARQDLAKLKQSRSAEFEDLSLQLEKSQKERTNLEKQLRDISNTRDKGDKELEKSRQAAASLKLSLSEVQAGFKQEMEEARAELKLAARRVEEAKAAGDKERAGLERQLRDANSSLEKLERELDRARQAPGTLKEGQSAETTRLKGELADARAEAKLAAGRLEEARAAASKERTNLERQLRDASSNQEKLERELDRARRGTSAGKDGQSTEAARLNKELEVARAQARLAAAHVNEVRDEGIRERDELEKQLRDAVSARQKLEHELEKARQAPASKPGPSLEGASIKDLEAARAEARLAATSSKENAATITRLNSELGEARTVIEKLERELDKARQAPAASKAGPALETASVKDLEAARGEARLAAAASREHAATIARLNNELSEARAVIEKLELRLTETKDSMNSEIVEQLRRQYDDRMQEVIQQKSALSEQLRGATSLLEAERMKLGAAEDATTRVGTASLESEIIDAEVARIQEMLTGIARLIDDPETELSTVIRKNVERAELDAYLKGILFSLGRGRGI